MSGRLSGISADSANLGRVGAGGLPQTLPPVALSLAEHNRKPERARVTQAMAASLPGTEQVREHRGPVSRNKRATLPTAAPTESALGAPGTRCL